MLGIIVVAHGRLAEDLVGALLHIVGNQENIEYVGIYPDDDIDKKTAELKKKIKNMRPSTGIVVLTDMFGGTPSNIAIATLRKNKVEVISGVNLPMLIRLCQSRDLSLQEAVAAAQDAGRKYISVASQLLEI